MAKYLEEAEDTVEHIDNGCIFDIIVEVFAGKRILLKSVANYHTKSIVRIEKNGKIRFTIVPVEGAERRRTTDRTAFLLDVRVYLGFLLIWLTSLTISVKSCPVRLSITAQSPMKELAGSTVQILELALTT